MSTVKVPTYKHALNEEDEGVEGAKGYSYLCIFNLRV